MKSLKYLLLAVLLLLASNLKAQTSFVTDRAMQQVNVLGTPTPLTAAIPYASVRVCGLPLTQQSPCLPLATITDINSNPISNSIGSNFGQLFTDVTGRYTFGCTANTNYQVQIAPSASNTPATNYPVSCPGFGNTNNLILGGTTTVNNLIATGAVTATNIDNVLQVCSGSTYTTVESALAALPTNGGKIVVCPGFRETFTTAPITVGSLTQGVLLDLTGQDINITCNSTQGASVWCWLVGDGGKIVGNGPQGPTLTTGSSTLSLASTANVAGLISPAVKTGGQEYFRVEGIILLGSCSATVGTALVDIEAVFDGSAFSNNLVQTSNSIVLRVAGNASTSMGQTVFLDNFVNGGGCTNAIPLVITGTSTTFPQNLVFEGGSSVNAGPSQPAIKIDGLGSSGCTNIVFHGAYAESDQTGPTNGIIIKDCHNVKFDQFQIFGSGANAPTNAVQIAQSAAGLTHDITLEGFASNSGTTVNNTITGATWTGGQALWQNYVYGGNNGGASIGGNITCESCGASPMDVGQDLTGIWHVSVNRGVRTGTIYNGANPAFDFNVSTSGGILGTVYNGVANGTAFAVDSAANFRIPKALVADAVNTVDIGNSNTGVKLPFRNIYFGSSATAYSKLITNATVARNLTLPDADSLTPSFLSCGTTSTCAKTNQTQLIIVNGGPIALSTGTLTITSLPFTSSTSYVCQPDDSTGINGIDVVYVSGSSVTFNGTGSDSIRYTCIGN